MTKYNLKIKANSYREALQQAKKYVKDLGKPSKGKKIVWWNKEKDKIFGKNWDKDLPKPTFYCITYEIKIM